MPSTEPQRAPRLPIWKRLLYATIVVALFVGIPEAILRWTDIEQRAFPQAFEDPYDKLPKGLWTLLTYDPVTYWMGRPHAPVPGTTEVLTARGLRGPDFSDDKPAGVQRIVCMGDSSTFGVVNHGLGTFTFNPTYSAELQRLLNEGAPAPRVEVINAGVIGYSTFQGLRFLKHRVRHWQPDVITIRYGVNDHWRFDPNYVPAFEPRNPLLRWIEDVLLDQQFFQLAIRVRSASRRRTFEEFMATAPTLNLPPGVPEDRVPLPEFDYNLRRLVIEGRASGARVVLMTAPLAPLVPEITSNRHTLDAGGYATYDELVANHQRYEEVVRQVAADLDVELVDTSRDFASRGPESYFTRHDLAHPNGEGHRAIARDLATLLRSKGMASQ